VRICGLAAIFPSARRFLWRSVARFPDTALCVELGNLVQRQAGDGLCEANQVRLSTAAD
jgi:hypothetical protein